MVDGPIHPTEWVLILSDWKKANADVTVHLRGGVSLGPGKVTHLPGSGMDSVGLHRFAHTVEYERIPETKWTFDLTEVAAITAVAR